MKALKKLKQQFEENPVLTIATVGLALRGAGYFIDSLSGIRSKNAYAKRSKKR